MTRHIAPEFEELVGHDGGPNRDQTWRGWWVTWGPQHPPHSECSGSDPWWDGRPDTTDDDEDDLARLCCAEPGRYVDLGDAGSDGDGQGGGADYVQFTFQDLLDDWASCDRQGRVPPVDVAGPEAGR